ncbi:outer membrane beta-barrel protein [Pelagicoccus albus]|uniref:Outer membrane beta-barrel protein n=1 Tax=Pelagicoccus albus TaxID=415222 RepID=A0A7X1B636_9BACT|nr:outer membrane beta-barrel protein [Pelagicoccus albus]MBC2606282.1 outer membrane beta-barrel protein [Pelagicoccus albus]
MRDSSIVKSVTTASLAAALHFNSAASAQSLDIGEATLRFEAIGALAYYSNPYLRDEALEALFPVEDSLAFILDPTAVLEMGDDQSVYRLSGEAGVIMRRFESISELNAEDFHMEFKASFKGSKSRWNFNAETQEISLPEHHTRFSSGTPDSSRSSANWDGSYRYSPRTRLNGGFSYYKRSFDDTEEFNYSDWESFSLPVRFYYQLTEKMELGGGVRYRERSQENYDQPNDLAWHLALEGELSSKLTADLKVGILDVQGSELTSSADGELFVSGRINWQATPDARISLSTERDTYATGINDSVLREDIALTAAWRISTKLSARTSVSHMKEDFDISERKDKVNRLTAALDYMPTDSQLFSSMSLSHEQNNSNIVGYDYKNLVFNWTTGWRF